MRQVDLAAAEHLLSPFSSPFFRVKWVYDYDYGFRGLSICSRKKVSFGSAKKRELECRL